MIFRFLAGTAFVTRPSAIFQGLLVGLFLQGAGRWGFDSILETVEQLIGDGTFGTSLPVFLTNSTTFAAAATQGVISWMSIEDAAVSSEGWDGYSLLVDDVVAQTGSATNFSIAALNTSLPHFFRYVALFFARVFKGTITYSTHFSHFADSPILKLELPETLRKPLPPSSSTLLGLIPLQELLDSSQLGSNFRLFVLFSLFDSFSILFICCLYLVAPPVSTLCTAVGIVYQSSLLHRVLRNDSFLPISQLRSTPSNLDAAAAKLIRKRIGATSATASCMG